MKFGKGQEIYAEMAAGNPELLKELRSEVAVHNKNDAPVRQCRLCTGQHIRKRRINGIKVLCRPVGKLPFSCGRACPAVVGGAEDKHCVYLVFLKIPFADKPVKSGDKGFVSAVLTVVSGITYRGARPAAVMHKSGSLISLKFPQQNVF